MEKRPNFYSILQLDPSITDWKKIEPIVQQKRREWSIHKNQGTPTQRRKAERFLKYMPDMESLFKDPESCKEELKSYKQEQKKAKQSQLEQLDNLIQNIHATSVNTELIKTLVRQTEKAFSEKEIEDRLKQNGIILDKGGKSKTKKNLRPKLEASVAKGIQDELNTLDLEDLYVFLNHLDHSPKLNRRSSSKSLYERSDLIYKEFYKKIDVDSSLIVALAGRAKSVFINDIEKDKYDNTLASQVLSELDKHLEVAGHDKFIETKEMLSLLQIGIKLGVTESIVEEYIEEYATKRKWVIQEETESVKVKLKICGNCDTLASSAQDKRCKNCGEELVQPCPKCGKPTPTENTACSQCGCHTGDARLVKSLMKDGKYLINTGDYDKAITLFNSALSYWDGWQPALNEKKLAESKKKESYEALFEIKTLIKERNLELADSKFDQYKHKFGLSNTADIHNQIDEGLAKAKAAFESGEKYRKTTKIELALGKYEESLSYCIDFSLAFKQKKITESKINESYEALNEIKALIKLRNLELANSQFDQYKQKFGLNNTTQIRDHINEGLAKAKAAFESGEKNRMAGKIELALDKYEESLTYCIDFSEALTEMAKSPPPPAPTNIDVMWLGNTLRLSWAEVKTRKKIRYKILRKINGVPANINDGDVVAETTIPQADDSKITPGIVYYYGVFSLRTGIESTDFAITGPHLLVTEVSHIICHSGNKQVSINWKTPSDNALIEVWRKENVAPIRRGEGKKVVVTGKSLLDTNLQNERQYGYLIVTKFRNPKDPAHFLFSKGMEILATPVAPPEPINDMKIQRDDHTVFLSWTPISGKAHTQIRQSQSPPPVTPGQIISLNDADQFGAPIPVTSSGRTQTTLKIQGRVFFVPLSVISDTAVLGKPVTVTTLDDVSDLTSKRNGNSIILIWQWPQGATDCLITYSHSQFPLSPKEKSASKEHITRAEYERINYWELRSVTRKKHYFTLYIRDPTANIYSVGINVLESMGQETIVRYKVVINKHFLTRKPKAAWIEFQCDNNPPLVDLIVVLKKRYPPVSKEDGEIIAEVNRLTFLNSISRIEIPEAFLKSRGYIKVFFSDVNAVKEIRLLPAEKEKLRLN